MKLNSAGKAIINQVINDIRQAEKEIADVKSIITSNTKGIGLDSWRNKLTDLEGYYNTGERKLERFRNHN